jgi:hypothetical protein
VQSSPEQAVLPPPLSVRFSTAAVALPAGVEPSADFHEIRRLAGLAQQVWDSDLSDAAKNAEVHRIEDQLEEIEDRLCDRSPTCTLSDLLCFAALVLYWSDCRGFADPVGTLICEADKGDCLASRTMRLAAAVFEVAGMGGANV